MADEPYSFAAKVIDGVNSGPHSVRISPMSGTPWTVLDYVGVLNAFGRGPLLIGHIPYVNNWTYAGFTLTAAIVDELNAEIDAVVAEFPYLPVEVVRTNEAFYSVDSCVSDGVHWSDSMHYRVFMLCKEKLSLWS
ncbi:hypothetical protein LMG26842_02579 [Achromobacter dolens]|nr:hypothetical protein LMG26842_02579 [Achromobacter dolens]